MESAFLSCIDALSEAELLPVLEEIGEDALAGCDVSIQRLLALYFRRVLPDCNCDPIVKPCDRPACIKAGRQESCDCNLAARLVFCEHISASRTHLLPLIGQAIVLRYVFPDKYADPPAPTPLCEEIVVSGQTAKAGVMEARAHRGEALRLAVDLAIVERSFRWRPTQEHIDRTGSRLMNGSDSKQTKLEVHGTDNRPRCHACGQPTTNDFCQACHCARWFESQELIHAGHA